MSGNLSEKTRRLWIGTRLAVIKFSTIDGTQRAAAFGYYAFLSLFPMMLLLVTTGSYFVDRNRVVGEITGYLENYVPLGEGMRARIFNTVSSIVKTRGKAGGLASLVLLWSSLSFFSALIRAVTRAWAAEVNNWWRLPLKSLALLGILASMVLLGIGLPVLVRFAWHWILPDQGWVSSFYRMMVLGIPLLVLFCGLSLFYKLAPRRSTRFKEVWPVALMVTAFLRLLETLFVVYLRNFAHFNAVYGAFGSIVALLIWIYLSGCLVIFGACLSAGFAQAAEQLASSPQSGLKSGTHGQAGKWERMKRRLARLPVKRRLSSIWMRLSQYFQEIISENCLIDIATRAQDNKWRKVVCFSDRGCAGAEKDARNGGHWQKNMSDLPELQPGNPARNGWHGVPARRQARIKMLPAMPGVTEELLCCEA